MGDDASQSQSKPTFDQSYPELEQLVERRRSSWVYTSVLPWDEVRSRLVIRLWEQFNRFDSTKGPLENWANRVISNAIQNLIRDECGRRYQKPCIGGGQANGKSCVHNLGGEACSYTPSKRQCAECPLYAKWEKTRQHQFNIKCSVALEHHTQEVHNIQGDFDDADEIKRKVDDLMRKELTAWEWRIYTLLFVEHVKPAAVASTLEAVVKTWKREPRADERYDYQSILIEQRRFKSMMIHILQREGYIDEYIEPSKRRHYKDYQ